MPILSIRRLAIYAASALIAVGFALPSAAVDLSKRQSFEIAPQPITSALLQFATQAKVQLISSNIQIKAHKSPGVNGEFTIGAALEQLLSGTGLHYRQAGDNTIIVTASVGSMRVAQDGDSSRDQEDRAVSTSQDSNAQGMNRVQDSSAQATDSSVNRIQEIVVTAQKREERLQDVPISISVLGGDNLDRSTLTGVAEELNSVPGLALRRDAGGSTVTVRGVGPQRNAGAGSTPIAYYVDGVPFALINQGTVVDAGSYDLERIEVMRGPQGSLYGASALGGVIRVLTKDATLDAWELKARGMSSSTEDGEWNYRGDMALNVPISPGKVALRGVVSYQDEGGWIDRPNQNVPDANDGRILNARLKLNAKPTDELSIALSAWQQQRDYDSGYRSNENLEYLRFAHEPTSQDVDVYGLKVSYEFAPFIVESTTGYLKQNGSGVLDVTPFFTYLGIDLGVFPLSSKNEHDIFSEEVSIKSTHAGPWRWSAGAMYREAKQRASSSDPANFYTSASEQGSESYSLFGELTRLFVDGKFEVTAGLRYFEDEVWLQETFNVTGAPLLGARDTFDNVSPRVILTWHPSRDLTAYASYSEGFRSGVYQNPTIARIAPGFPPVKPDTLNNYELGSKWSALDGRLAFDTALYYIDWQEVQNQLVVQAFNATINGGSASGMGLDFALTARPIDAVELGASISWNDLTWDADVISSNTVLFDKGERLNVSPEYTAGAWINYVFPFGRNGFEGQLSASANFISEQDERTLQGTQALIGFGDDILTARTSFSLQSPNNWVATVFVDNVTNESGAIYRDMYPNQSLTGDLFVRPRTIGLQLEYRY